MTAMTRLSHLQNTIFILVRDNPGITMSEILDAVYADDPDGGPDSGRAVIGGAIRKFNKKRKGVCVIKGRRGRGPGNSYLLHYVNENPT